MKDGIRALSGRTEFLVVIIGAFGIFLPSNLLALITPATALPRTGGSITTSSLTGLICYELAVLALLGTFLRTRGWTLQKVGFAPNVRDTFAGVALTVGSYAVHVVILTLIVWVYPALLAGGQIIDQLVKESLDIPTVLAVSVINPIFEEVFVCAYVVTALKDKRSITFAVNLSTALRVAYHLYQGTFGVVSIAPIGLIFAYWYARTNRLWPVIVAHGAMDLMALLTLSSAAG